MEQVVLYPGNNFAQYFTVSQLICIEDVFEEGYLTRRVLDKKNIEMLVVSELKNVPPIELVSTNKGMVVIDGYHRWEAAKKLKLETISGITRTFSNVNEVIEAAFKANIKHGKQASTVTRSQYAWWLWLSNNGKLSEGEIARRVGISYNAVHQYIKKQLAEYEHKYNGTPLPIKAKKPVDYTSKFIQSLNLFVNNKDGDIDAMAMAIAKRTSKQKGSIDNLLGFSDMFKKAASIVSKK